MMSEATEQNDLYQQNTDFELIKALIPYIGSKSFIDIGAEKGSFTRFLSSHHFNGTFFEPLPKFAEELTLLAKETQCKFLSYAVDHIDRTADFYTASDHNDNPMDYFSSLHPLRHDQRISHKKVTTVTCRSLNSLLQEGCINKHIGIVKIDTEGNDLNVLKGMNEVESEVLMCEYFMPGIYEGWSLGHPLGLIDEAKKLGFNHYLAIKRFEEFEVVSIDNMAFIDKQWGNLVFIKDAIFDVAKEDLRRFVAKNEIQAFSHMIAFNQMLKNTCEERLDLINKLDGEIKLLRDAIGEQTTQIAFLTQEKLEREQADLIASQQREPEEQMKSRWFKWTKIFRT